MTENTNSQNSPEENNHNLEVNTEEKHDTSQEPKHKTLKFMLKLFIIVFILLFIITKCNSWQTQDDIKKLFISTNSQILNQDLTINRVEYNALTGATKLSGLSIFNPEGFTDTALYSGEVLLYTSKNAFTELPLEKKERQNKIQLLKTNLKDAQKTAEMFVYEAVFSDVTINYETVNNNVNLHLLADNIIRTLHISDNSPLAIFNREFELPLNYEGAMFMLNRAIFISPKIIIFKDGKPVKQINIKSNITIDFNQIKQPSNYGHFLLAGSLDFINKLDNYVK